MKEGIYFHEKKGFALAFINSDNQWTIDKNYKRRHPFLRCSTQIVEILTGEYFFNKSLKNYTFICES